MTFANEPIAQWIKMEHYRLHSVEEWPESPYKDATLAAIYSALQRLETASSEALESQQCAVCASRKARAVVLQMPSRSNVAPAVPAAKLLAA
ncbi:MAG TPA: hypothetical protein VGF59_08320 [Bryobacteraceae bacterium]|jgi:hypothetical protein